MVKVGRDSLGRLDVDLHRRGLVSLQTIGLVQLVGGRRRAVGRGGGRVDQLLVIGLGGHLAGAEQTARHGTPIESRARRGCGGGCGRLAAGRRRPCERLRLVTGLVV